MPLLFFPVTIASSVGCQKTMLLCVTNGTQPVLSDYIIHLFIDAQSKNRLALTFQTWLQQRLSSLCNKWAEGGKRMVGELGQVRNQSRHPRKQHSSLLGYRFCYFYGKVWEWEKPGNLGNTIELRHSMSTSPEPAELHALCNDVKLKAILRSRTEE